MADHTQNCQPLLSKVKEILAKYPLYTEGYLVNDNDKYLIEGDNLMLFEKVSDGKYQGHFFFEDRGAKAFATALLLLDKAFSSFATIIQGLSPISHSGSKWLAKKVGGTSYGIIQTINGPCELFIMTKAQWRDKWGS